MQYNQPYGVTDDNAAYINGNPATGTAGSIPPAAAFEYPQREIVNFITDSGLTPDNSDLHQISRAVQSGEVSFGIDSGAANAMVIALTPVPLALVPGLTVRVKKGGDANTGASTLDVGLGAHSVQRSTGADLEDGDLPANCMFEVTWSGSAWQMTNFQGLSAGSTTTNTYTLKVPYCIDTGSANAVDAPFSPAITALADGDFFSVRLAHNITGAANIMVNALGPYALVDANGVALTNGAGLAGTALLCQFDGTNVRAMAGLIPTAPPWTPPTPGAIGSYVNLRNQYAWASGALIGALNTSPVQYFTYYGSSDGTDSTITTLPGTWAYAGENGGTLGVRVA